MAKKRDRAVITELCAAVAAKYQTEGDITKAGVVVACLSFAPPRFYASVARYPSGPTHKQVVCQVGRPGSAEEFTTAEAALKALAVKWANANEPAPVVDTMANLRRVL